LPQAGQQLVDAVIVRGFKIAAVGKAYASRYVRDARGETGCGQIDIGLRAIPFKSTTTLRQRAQHSR
jgi:hypothetical protein